MRRVLLLLVLLLVFAGAASATDYYVATWGDNTTQGNFTHPWQNVSYATQQAVAGDTIYLFDGTWYNEHATFANSGNATHPITLTAYNGTPKLDGVDRTGTGIAAGTDKDYIRISHLEVYNYQHAISIAHSSYCTVSNCEMYNTGGVTFFLSDGNDTHNTIENCSLHDGGWNILMMLGNHEADADNSPATHMTVRNCTIYNSAVHNAIDLHGNLQNVTIEDNELYNNSAGCIFTHDGLDHREYVTIRDNNFHDTLSIPINIDVTTHSEIYNNTFNGIYIGSSKTEAIYIAGSSAHDFEIYNNSFYDCNGPKLSTAYNITFDDNYIHTNSTMYKLVSGADCIVENPSGIMDIDIGDPSGTAELLFEDGTVFTASYYWLGSYVPVRYYPEKSNTSGVAKTDDWGTINTVTSYNITLHPTNAYLKSVSINHESDAADDRTNINVNSSVSTNPTWINATMQNASANYSIAVDSSIVDHIIADSGGIVRYQYTSSWSSHSFEFNWVDQGTFLPDHSKSYYNATSSITNAANSTGYVKYDRTLGCGDTVCSSGRMVVTT